MFFPRAVSNPEMSPIGANVSPNRALAAFSPGISSSAITTAPNGNRVSARAADSPL
jgi:hypothetical protein